MRRGARMRPETAEFHAVITEPLELVQDDVEVVGGLFLVEQIRPGADGDASLGHDGVPCGMSESRQGVPVVPAIRYLFGIRAATDLDGEFLNPYSSPFNPIAN